MQLKMLNSLLKMSRSVEERSWSHVIHVQTIFSVVNVEQLEESRNSPELKMCKSTINFVPKINNVNIAFILNPAS